MKGYEKGFHHVEDEVLMLGISFPYLSLQALLRSDAVMESRCL
jgi:hypothetical protein